MKVASSRIKKGMSLGSCCFWKISPAGLKGTGWGTQVSWYGDWLLTLCEVACMAQCHSSVYAELGEGVSAVIFF